ncbi:hypothetical protein H0H92_015361 [Tricholoma furcatifolium]|nr:hypothetical protein H0H92_015361 [Tricholoma furcatifolium]
MLFTALPTDILILILETLAVQDLVALALTCKSLNSWVAEFGWKAYLKGHPRPSFSLSQSRKIWSAHAQVHYNCLSDRSWSRSEFVARPLSKPWSGKMQPVMAISPSRLVIAAGSGLSSYGFGISGHGEAPSMRFEGSYHFAQFNIITSMTFIEDGGLDETLCLGFQDGALRQVSLKFHSVEKPALKSLGVVESSFLQLRGGEYIESLSSEQNVLLTLSSSGAATLTNLHFTSTQSENVSLNALPDLTLLLARLPPNLCESIRLETVDSRHLLPQLFMPTQI